MPPTVTWQSPPSGIGVSGVYRGYYPRIQISDVAGIDTSSVRIVVDGENHTLASGNLDYYDSTSLAGSTIQSGFYSATWCPIISPRALGSTTTVEVYATSLSGSAMGEYTFQYSVAYTPFSGSMEAHYGVAALPITTTSDYSYNVRGGMITGEDYWAAIRVYGDNTNFDSKFVIIENFKGREDYYYNIVFTVIARVFNASANIALGYRNLFEASSTIYGPKAGLEPAASAAIQGTVPYVPVVASATIGRYYPAGFSSLSVNIAQMAVCEWLGISVDQWGSNLNTIVEVVLHDPEFESVLRSYGVNLYE